VEETWKVEKGIEIYESVHKTITFRGKRGTLGNDLVYDLQIWIYHEN